MTAQVLLPKHRSRYEDYLRRHCATSRSFNPMPPTQIWVGTDSELYLRNSQNLPAAASLSSNFRTIAARH